MNSRAEYECGAGGLLDGVQLNDQLPHATGLRSLLACERTRSVEWLGAVAFAWLIIAALRYESPQNTIHWIAEVVRRVLIGE